MALKKRAKSRKNKKGILLTLLTLVMFTLMLGEIITYVVLNINYDNLSTSVAQSLASGNFAQNLDSGMNAFIYSSLSKSMDALILFESNPGMRHGRFLNDSSKTIAVLLSNGTIYNNTGLYYNSSFDSAIKEFEAEALTDGFSANLSNITLRIGQTSPFRVGAYITGFAALNTSSGIVLNYPINANTTISLNSRPSLIGAEQGLNGTFQKSALPTATIVGNLTAKSGSTSPYMFAYAKVIYVSGEPTCADISSAYENENYILATPNAFDIGQNVCGMAGLITNISNSSTPLKPYLDYANDSIMSYLQSDPNVLINGASLELVNTSAIQSSVKGGFYYSSPYAASYLQRVNGKPYLQSPNGIFSFRSADRRAAYFTAPGQNITIPKLTAINGSNAAAMSAWIYINSLGNNQIVLSDDWSSLNTLQMYVHTNGALEADFGSGSAWTVAAETGAGSISVNRWYLVTATWTSGEGESIYINGVKQQVSYIVGNAIATGTLEATAQGNIAANQGNGGSFDGFIANLQIYNKSLSQYQASSMYMQGINNIPVSNKGLIAWYPLSSNANDYSGNNYNGVPTNVIYDGISGYTLNPTEQQTQNYISSVAQFNGQSSYIQIPNSANLQLNNVTISGWVKYTGPSSGYWNWMAAKQSAWGVGACSTNLAVCFYNWGTSTEYESSTTLNTNTWYFLTAVISNGIETVYVNGKNVLSDPLSVSSQTTVGLQIGYGNAGNQFLNGSATNIQVYNTALSINGIEALYHGGMSDGPINTQNLVGWWPLDGNANDYSSSGNNGISYNVNYTPQELPASTSPLEGVLGCNSMSSCNVSSQRLYLSGLPLENAGLGLMNASTSMGMQNGVIPAASQFNGVGYDYAPIGSYFGTNNNLTAEAWVYATPNSNGPIFGVTSGGAASGGWNMPFLSESGLTVHGYIWPGSDSDILNYTLPHSGWYNLIVTYNATDSEQTFYVNGVDVGSDTATYSPSGDFDYWTTYISGAKPTGVNNILSSTIADVQLYKSSLSQQQAWQLYLNNSVEGISAADYWPLGEGNGNLLNETENIVNQSNYGYLYDSAVVACTNSQVVSGNCGVSYVPG